MKNLFSLGLRFENNKLLVLNQQLLPAQEQWIECQSPQHMHTIIHSLQVRGAPLIGIAAALALAHYVEQGADEQQIHAAAKLLISARPTAVNLAHCIQRQIQAYRTAKNPQVIVKIAEQLFAEDAQLSANIAKHGTALLQSGDNILTHCNTGGLVTTGIGTALGIIIAAHQQGKKLHVYVDETRPLLQGARLTAWELQRAGISYTLICDNMAASLMRAGKIQKVIVGADRIAANGDFANKIGTYSVAVLANYHQVPFYVAAPYTTVDLNCPQGNAINIEQRAANEIRGAAGAFGKIIWSPENCDVYNPAFDVTPAELVTSYILDKGLVTARDLSRVIASEVKQFSGAQGDPLFA